MQKGLHLSATIIIHSTPPCALISFPPADCSAEVSHTVAFIAVISSCPSSSHSPPPPGCHVNLGTCNRCSRGGYDYCPPSCCCCHGAASRSRRPRQRSSRRRATLACLKPGAWSLLGGRMTLQARRIDTDLLTVCDVSDGSCCLGILHLRCRCTGCSCS